MNMHYIVKRDHSYLITTNFFPANIMFASDTNYSECSARTSAVPTSPDVKIKLNNEYTSIQKYGDKVHDSRG